MNIPAEYDQYDLANLKTPPHSLEAEQAVLGGLMIAGNRFSEVFDAVSELLTDADFYRPGHQVIFRQIEWLAEASKPVDAITLCDVLDSAGELEQAGGFEYLMDLAQGIPSASNIRAYAEAVKERAVLRGLIAAGQSIADSGFDTEGRSSAELIDSAQTAVLALSDGVDRQQDLHCATRLKSLVDEWQRRSEADGLIGLSTGFEKLDRRTNGLSPGDLIILAARPSMGKTSLAMNIAEHVAVDLKLPVLVFSMEMTAEQLLDRMAASVGKIPYELIRTGKLFDDPDHGYKAIPAISRIQESPLYIDDRAALTVQQMRTTARKLHKKAPLSLIVVDYLQLARAKGESRVMEVTAISQGLKALAKELRVPVLALSQLSRSVESRTDKRPINSDLRDSGAIEQDADVIWFIYRDEIYDENSRFKGVAEIRCTKQRNGPTGEDYLATRLDRCRFENLDHSWQRPENVVPMKRRKGFEL